MIPATGPRLVSQLDTNRGILTPTSSPTPRIACRASVVSAFAFRAASVAPSPRAAKSLVTFLIGSPDQS